MLRFDKATYLSLLLKSIFSKRLSGSLKESDVLLLLEFIKMISILYYAFIGFIILLYIFLVISFAWYKEYMIWRISFSNGSKVLPAFTCARAIGNLWSICLGVNISSLLPSCCLLKSRIFSIISITLFGFSLSGVFLLLTAFLKSIKESLTWFTICLFIFLLTLYKSFATNDRFWYLKYSMNVSVLIFISYLIMFSKNL